MMIGGFAVLVVLALLIWLSLGVRRINAVSAGVEIETRPGTALVLIDLQTVFWDHGLYSTAAKMKAEAAIQAEIHQAKVAGNAVIALRQEWSLPATRVISRLMMKGQAIVGTPGTELAAPFVDAADRIVVKRVQDGFETGELDRVLAELNVGELRIVGLDLNYCVLKTALAARARGYKVTIIEQGTLAARPNEKTLSLLSDKSISFA